MPGVNKVILVGNLGQDPEIRYMTNGNAIANFSLATSETWKDKHTGEKKEQTEWHRCVAFKRLAEIIGEYAGKGSKVYVEGSLQTRSYDKDGQKRYSTEIIVKNLQLLDSKGQKPRNEDAYQGGQTENRFEDQAPPPPAGNDFEDDIPFMRIQHEYCF